MAGVGGGLISVGSVGVVSVAGFGGGVIAAVVVVVVSPRWCALVVAY